MKVAAEHILGAATAGVECRSGVCRIPFVLPDPVALERLRAEPGLHDLIRKEQQAGDALYLTMGENGQSVVSRLLTPTRAPRFFAGCPEPERAGNLLLRVLVPATGAANDDGVPGRASVRALGGSLSATPAGDCLAERVAAVTGEDLPVPVGGGLRFESWTWEPGQAPVLTPSP
jgi:hypothetical protein